MARKRITEHTAKKILYPKLGLELKGSSVEYPSSSTSLSSLSTSDLYVVKVDQGIKKRMKQGLVKVKVTQNQIQNYIEETAKKGYSHFFVEEFIDHNEEDEKYLSLERTREGTVVFYSNKGGIDVEENTGKIQKAVISSNKEQAEVVEQVDSYLSLPKNTLEQILKVFDDSYFSFLEINPLVIKDGAIHILDLAVEVDSTAEFFVNKAWSSADFVDHFSQKKTEEEKIVQKLAQESQAAFSLEVLNEEGSIFVLLSGGGASLVIADEVYNLGFGKELANYGEYSGNPNSEETYIYTKAILSLLIRSKAEKKALIIGGGVANFTDIRTTFKGVVKALEEYKDTLKKQSIQILVRRGGPHQKEGLEMLSAFLERSGLVGEVYGPDVVLTSIVQKSIDIIKG